MVKDKVSDVKDKTNIKENQISSLIRQIVLSYKSGPYDSISYTSSENKLAYAMRLLMLCEIVESGKHSFIPFKNKTQNNRIYLAKKELEKEFIPEIDKDIKEVKEGISEAISLILLNDMHKNVNEIIFKTYPSKISKELLKSLD